jgi:hypothetical protein
VFPTYEWALGQCKPGLTIYVGHLRELELPGEFIDEGLDASLVDRQLSI